MSLTSTVRGEGQSETVPLTNWPSPPQEILHSTQEPHKAGIQGWGNPLGRTKCLLSPAPVPPLPVSAPAPGSGKVCLRTSRTSSCSGRRTGSSGQYSLGWASFLSSATLPPVPLMERLLRRGAGGKRYGYGDAAGSSRCPLSPHPTGCPTKTSWTTSRCWRSVT